MLHRAAFVHILTEIMLLTVNAVHVRFVKNLYTDRHGQHITFLLPCKEGLTTFMTKITIHNKYTFQALKHKRHTAVWLFCTLEMPQAIHMTDKQLQLLMQLSTKWHQEISKCYMIFTFLYTF